MKKVNSALAAKIQNYLLVFAAAIFLSAFTFVQLNETEKVKKEIGPEDWADYKNWYKATKEPNTGDPTGFLDKKHKGEKAYRDVYVNTAGEATMKDGKSFPFPEGTIIVKEAFKDKKSYDAQKKPELTIMVKLADDAAPDTNNWEFFMGADGKLRGAGLDTKWGKFCGSCHINAIAKDYSFMAGGV